MCRAPDELRTLVDGCRDSPVNTSSLGLVCALTLPTAVLLATIFLPSDYDE